MSIWNSVKKGLIEKVQVIKSTVTAPMDDEKQAVIKAIEEGDIAKLKDIIKTQQPITDILNRPIDENGNTPLARAIVSEANRDVLLLLSNQATDIEQSNKHKSSLIDSALFHKAKIPNTSSIKQGNLEALSIVLREYRLRNTYVKEPQDLYNKVRGLTTYRNIISSLSTANLMLSDEQKQDARNLMSIFMYIGQIPRDFSDAVTTYNKGKDKEEKIHNLQNSFIQNGETRKLNIYGELEALKQVQKQHGRDSHFSSTKLEVLEENLDYSLPYSKS